MISLQSRHLTVSQYVFCLYKWKQPQIRVKLLYYNFLHIVLFVWTILTLGLSIQYKKRSFDNEHYFKIRGFFVWCITDFFLFLYLMILLDLLLDYRMKSLNFCREPSSIIFPLGSINIIPSHLRRWKCPNPISFFF